MLGDCTLSISWIKAKSDEKSFRLFKNMGFDVLELEDLEKTDDVISDLIRKTSRYHCINK